MSEIEQRISIIHEDREHGSSWLVHHAVTLMYDLARGTLEPDLTETERVKHLYATGKELAQARPAMAALASAIGRVLSQQGNAESIAHKAEQLLQELASATTRITEHARPFLKGRLMTCSISGTVLAVLLNCKQQIDEVVTLEGRPRYEGRTLARSLSEQGIAVTLITDAQADIFLPQCSGVVVGADSILANGDVLNKAGTALLGWAAHGRGIPFYVLCETLKISPQSWSEEYAANLTLLEEKEGEEVLEQPIAGVHVRNFYFDHTPYSHVSKIITEHGILDQQSISRIARQAQENLSRLT